MQQKRKQDDRTKQQKRMKHDRKDIRGEEDVVNKLFSTFVKINNDNNSSPANNTTMIAVPKQRTVTMFSVDMNHFHHSLEIPQNIIDYFLNEDCNKINEEDPMQFIPSEREHFLLLSESNMTLNQIINEWQKSPNCRLELYEIMATLIRNTTFRLVNSKIFHRKTETILLLTFAIESHDVLFCSISFFIQNKNLSEQCILNRANLFFLNQNRLDEFAEKTNNENTERSNEESLFLEFEKYAIFCCSCNLLST